MCICCGPQCNDTCPDCFCCKDNMCQKCCVSMRMGVHERLDCCDCHCLSLPPPCLVHVPEHQAAITTAPPGSPAASFSAATLLASAARPPSQLVDWLPRAPPRRSGRMRTMLLLCPPAASVHMPHARALPRRRRRAPHDGRRSAQDSGIVAYCTPNVDRYSGLCWSSSCPFLAVCVPTNIRLRYFIRLRGLRLNVLHVEIVREIFDPP